MKKAPQLNDQMGPPFALYSTSPHQWSDRLLWLESPKQLAQKVIEDGPFSYLKISSERWWSFDGHGFFSLF